MTQRTVRADYLSTCDSCEWYKLCVKAASVRNAQRNGRRHAQSQPGHGVAVINLQRLETVTNYRFDALDQVDAPPF